MSFVLLKLLLGLSRFELAVTSAVVTPPGLVSIPVVVTPAVIPVVTPVLPVVTSVVEETRV
jgi:hypothetical protein